MVNNIREKNVSDLLLDLENPRLLEQTKFNNQKDALDYMVAKYAVEELIKAIGENGYFSGEPLVIIKNKVDSGYIVVEGNRRLAALKILNNPELAKDGAIKKLAKSAKQTPLNIPCVEFKNRDEVLSYLGLRHVVGVKSWGPLAKARYIEKMLENLEENIPTDKKIKHISRSMGSRSDYVRKSLLTLYVYDIVKDNGFFELKDVGEETFLFSVFMSALSKPSIKKFLGMPNNFNLNFSEKVKLKNLELIVKIVCEKRNGGKTILGHPREIASLAIVVETPKAVERLRETSSIEEALRETNSINKNFSSSLYEAKAALADAQNNVQELRKIDNPEEVKESIRVMDKRLNSIKNELSSSHNIIFP